jgi:hypothetical protein
MVVDYDSSSDFGNSSHSVVELIIWIVPNSADSEKHKLRAVCSVAQGFNLIRPYASQWL